MGRTAIIGFGCAGYHAAKTLREHDANAVIDVYSDTAEAPYNPMLTTYFVSEKIGQEGMFPFGELEQIRAELGVNILAMPTHIAGMPCAVNINCHVTRHKSKEI